MSKISLFDADSTCIPFAADDELIECGPDDPAWGDPESWPAWTDASQWELGPAIPPDAEVVPFEPTAEDWEEAALVFDHLELPSYPAEYPATFTEADARAAGLAI